MALSDNPFSVPKGILSRDGTLTVARQVEIDTALRGHTDVEAYLQAIDTNIRTLQNTAFNSGRTYQVFQDGFTITDANIATFEDVNNIYAAKNDKPFDNATRPDINLPTDAHIAAAGESYPVVFEFTHLGGSARFTDRNVLRFFFNGVQVGDTSPGYLRDQVVIVTKPASGEDYEFQASEFNPNQTILPNGVFNLKTDTPINNIANIATELAGVTINVGDAFFVETGGAWSGLNIPNGSVLVALANGPSLVDSASNTDWLLLDNGRINSEVAMFLANYVRDGIRYDATRNIRVHPDNVTVFNSMATGDASEPTDCQQLTGL